MMPVMLPRELPERVGAVMVRVAAVCAPESQ